MEKTPRGTAVGVDDPYEYVGVCDHLTGEGRCRYAYDHYGHDPEFARERAAAEYACLVVDTDADTDTNFGVEVETGCATSPEWAACPHFRSRTQSRECVRCGLEEKRLAQEDERPLLEEHHLSYASDGETPSHEITVFLCRWCHARVHNSWARITDDVAPDPEAIAALEGRRSRELEACAFESAAERLE